ncbi:MAG: hypothetical protein RR140_03880 [Clostridia bacterium]
MNFSSEKNGYNKHEVDIEIENLMRTNIRMESELKKEKFANEEIKSKSENISIALTAAVEKAKQIEQSSANVYGLKIQQLNLLYNRWDRLLTEILTHHPEITEVENIQAVLQDFKNAIKQTLKEDFKISSYSSFQSQSDPIRQLLAKIGKTEKSKSRKATIARQSLPADLESKQSELSRISEKSFITKVKPKQMRFDDISADTTIKEQLNGIEERPSLIKPIYSSAPATTQSLFDAFLNEKPTENSAYSKIITSNSSENNFETTFDLKEAVSPKEDLETIMRAFDFFKDEENK